MIINLYIQNNNATIILKNKNKSKIILTCNISNNKYKFYSKFINYHKISNKKNKLKKSTKYMKIILTWNLSYNKSKFYFKYIKNRNFYNKKINQKNIQNKHTDDKDADKGRQATGENKFHGAKEEENLA